MLAVMVGKKQPNGEGRRQKRDLGKALAGKSTLKEAAASRSELIAVNWLVTAQIWIDMMTK